jgi:hypothetical protein
MESTQETVSAPPLAITSSKPDLTWLVYAGVVIITAGVTSVITIIAKRRKAKADEKKAKETAPKE